MGQKLLVVLLLLAPLGVYPFLRNGNAPIDDPSPVAPSPLTKDEHLAFACFAFLPGQSFPAAIPWEPLRDIGQQRSQMLEEMAKTKPIAFLEYCLKQYEKDVRGYRLIFLKQEKVMGQMRPKEKIRIHFREKPFSVHMDWIEGKGKAARTIYVEGENDGKLVARPLLLGVESPVLFKRRVDDPDALRTSRFPITEFGIYKGAKNTVAAIRAADKVGTLHLRYEGIVPLKEVGNRRCYKFVRTPYEPAEEDGINELTFFIDVETLLQVGSVLRDENGDLIADYFFRDIELNSTFDEKQFTAKAL